MIIVFQINRKEKLTFKRNFFIEQNGIYLARKHTQWILKPLNRFKVSNNDIRLSQNFYYFKWQPLGWNVNTTAELCFWMRVLQAGQLFPAHPYGSDGHVIFRQCPLQKTSILWVAPTKYCDSQKLYFSVRLPQRTEYDILSTPPTSN